MSTLVNVAYKTCDKEYHINGNKRTPFSKVSRRMFLVKSNKQMHTNIIRKKKPRR